ncbi:MAG: T9SS type A sorting domain-containing protein [Candidatus Azobacteroides sp.]|nr:T9SS type A sorting domain-containing protein [Candidatus Azobacteroides sp.]
MKSMYKYAVLTAIIMTTFSTRSQGQENLSLSIGFEDAAPASIDGVYCDGNIEIETRNVESRPVYDRCFGVIGSPERSSLYLNGNPVYSADRFAYILIRNKGSKDILRVVLRGVSNTGSDAVLTTEFSEEADPSESDYEIDDTMRFPSDAADVECVENSTGTGGWWPSGIKTIRFMHSNRYANMNTTNPPRPCIQSLEIYTDGTYTSLPEQPETGAFRSGVKDNELYLTEEASTLEIYTVSGMLIKKTANVRSLPLNTLSGGVYLIRAESRSGETLITKIVR